MKSKLIIIFIACILFSLVSCDFYSIIFGADSIALTIDKIMFYENENKELDFDVMGALEGNKWYVHIPPTVNPDVKLIPQFEGKYDEILLDGANYEKGNQIQIVNSISILIKKSEKMEFYTLVFINDTLLINSFKIEASRNPVLVEDIIGYIFDDTINIPLPYNIARDRIKLIPTIKISPGNTISPDPNLAQDYKDGLNYYLSGSGISIAKEYKIIASIDTDTMTYLHVDEPFYVLGTVEYPIDVYEIEYDNSNIVLKVPTNMFKEIQGQRVGFHSIDYPFNVKIDTNLFYGHHTPYQVPVISDDGHYSTDYKIDLQREIVTGTDISVKYEVQEIYRYTIESYHDGKAYNNWLNKACGIDKAENLNITSDFKNHFKRKFYMMSEFIKPSGKCCYKQTNGTMFSNNQQNHNEIINFPPPLIVDYEYSNPIVISGDKKFLNNAIYSVPDKIVLEDKIVPRKYQMIIGVGLIFIVFQDNFNWHYWTTKTYNNPGYYKVNKVIVNGPDYCTFKNLTTFEDVIDYSINENILILNLINNGGEKLSGAIAFFDVIAESGNESKSYFIVIE